MFTRTFSRWIISLIIAVASLIVINTLLTQAGAQAQEPKIAAAIRYVAIEGLDANNHCNNSTRPCATVQHAIDEANDGDEIRVATGIYTDVQVREAITQVAYINKTLIVQGGYTITDWLNSNPISYPTTLDAQGRGRVLTIIGAVASTIAGFKITGGDALGLGGDPVWGADAGGGALVISATVTLSHDVVANNHAPGIGGGIYAQQPLTIIESDFLSNTVDAAGGGAYVETAVTITGSRFIGNRSTQGCGGGVCMGGSTPTAIVVNSFFENNWSFGPAGGGISTEILYLTNTHFVSNTSYYGGGARALEAYVAGGLFERNAAYFGGGLMAKSLHISGTLFLSNTSSSNGGGLYVRTAELTNVRLENNHADQAGTGGGLYADRVISMTGTSFIGNAAASGGGLYLDMGGDGRVENTVFARNTAAIDGAAIAVVSTGSLTLLHTTIADVDLNPKAAVVAAGVRLNLTNTLIASHTVAISNSGGTIYEDYNLFFGNVANTVGSITSGGHSLIGDPRFVDPFNGDYHLRFPSLAIDHGANVGVYTDLDGNPRPVGLGFDIGAYEYQGGIRYVATSGTDTSNDCLDEAAPCATVQHAIDVAHAGEQVLIATGLYTESATLYKPVSLTGVNSTTTIIHAVEGQRVLTVTGATITNSVMISGLTFTGGEADYGGGVLITDTAQPLIRDLIFFGNNGGGLYTDAPTLTLIDSVFDGNTGGGAWAGKTRVIGGRFSNNVGPGLYVDGALEVTSTQFLSNTRGAVVYGPAMIVSARFENNNCPECYEAAGLTFYGYDSLGNHPLTLSNTIFISNSPGGVYAEHSSLITVDNSRFERNFTPSSGGGLWAYESPLHMSNVEVLSNTARDGGGIAVSGYSVETILINCHLENNSATWDLGGGLYADQFVYLTDTQFISNSAGAGGGVRALQAYIYNSRFERNTAIYDVGGGLVAGDLFMSGTVFISNTAYHGGGGGALTSNTTVLGGRFENNRVLSTTPGGTAAGGGGALLFYEYAEHVMISGTQFVSNAAASFGGGIHFDSSFGTPDNTQSRLVNALFANNMADLDGAALAFNATGHHDLLHTTIADNALNPQTAVAVFSGTLNLTNTIITSHAIAISNTGGIVYEDYNLFFGNVTNTIGSIISGGHSLIGDPRFVDPVNGDYHLRFPSPAIDRGANVGVYTDLDGNPRPVGLGFDIGAYEYQGSVAYVFLPLMRK